ncbi:MAG: Abi-alpha family protein [Sulfurimonas sp.]|jgi:hypothetical protein
MLSKEEAVAVVEVAKTTNNAINKGAELTKFIAKLFSPSLNNLAEICEQYTAVWKIENALKLQDRLNIVLEKRGNPELISQLPLRIGLPLLEAALNEDDDNLQNLWANLLASSMTNENQTKSTKTYIEILKQLDIEDAKLLHTIHMIQPNAIFNKQTGFANIEGKSVVDISFAVNNLERLGLIQVHTKSEKEMQDTKRNIFEENEAQIIHLLFIKKDDTSFKNFSVYLSLKLLGDYFMHSCVGPTLIDGNGHGFIMLDDRFSYDV